MNCKIFLLEHSNKKRLQNDVCDEICFHGRAKKTIISLQFSVRSVPIFGAKSISRFSKLFSKEKVLKTSKAIKNKKKKKKTIISFEKLSFRAV